MRYKPTESTTSQGKTTSAIALFAIGVQEYFMPTAALWVTRSKKVGNYLVGNSGNRTLSSVGSEHLPYKQRVLGSNPRGCTIL